VISSFSFSLFIDCFLFLFPIFLPFIQFTPMSCIWFWVGRVPWPSGARMPFWRNAIAEYSHLFTPSSSHSSFRFFHIISPILPPIFSSHLSRSDRWPAIFVVRPFLPLPSSFNHVANIIYMRCFRLLLLHFPRGDGGRFFVRPSLPPPPLCVKVISDQDDGKGHSTVLLLAQIFPH
jgi:hypothetical protein